MMIKDTFTKNEAQLYYILITTFMFIFALFRGIRYIQQYKPTYISQKNRKILAKILYGLILHSALGLLTNILEFLLYVGILHYKCKTTITSLWIRIIRSLFYGTVQ